MSEVARELLTARISDDDAALAEIIAKLGDDAAPIRLATRLRAIRMVFAVPAERIRAHVHELGELFESAVPQVRAAFLDGIRGDSLDPEIAQFVDRALADAAPSVRSAAAGLARRMHDAGWR